MRGEGRDLMGRPVRGRYQALDRPRPTARNRSSMASTSIVLKCPASIVFATTNWEAEFLQTVELARHVHQRHVRGDVGHGNLASLGCGRRIIVLGEILDGRIGGLLRCLRAWRQNIGLVDQLSSCRIVEIATDLPCVGFDTAR
jgi:hypothetical protein